MRKIGHRANECKGEVACFSFKKVGHKASECRSGKSNGGGPKFVIEITRENPGGDKVAQEATKVGGQNISTKAVQEATKPATNNELTKWKYDTACSNTCTPKKRLVPFV